MTTPYAPIEVIRTTPSGRGLLHVSEYLARAVGETMVLPALLVAAEPAPEPTRSANAGIAKCLGAGLACCSVCVRALTHEATAQQWCEPDIVDGACTLYASLERFGALVGK